MKLNSLIYIVLVSAPTIFLLKKNPEQKTFAAEFEIGRFQRIQDQQGLLQFATPEGVKRVNVDENSYAEFLRNLPLKDRENLVKTYQGNIKPAEGVYCAVVNWSLGDRDLQQCADAVMRQRAEYLYSQGRLNEIRFNFLSDGEPRYFVDYPGDKNKRETFDKYLNYIFAYANTSSLHDELVEVEDIKDIQIGDVLVQKGSPYGHAVCVVDLAQDTLTQDMYAIISQSYMPAQDIQILINPNNEVISPWIKMVDGEIKTPEWTFTSSDLRRFKDEDVVFQERMLKQ